MIEEILGYEDGKIQTKTLYEFKEVGTENEKVKGSIMKVAELENTGKLVAAGY
jgi:pilus assembly protein CpaF